MKSRGSFHLDSSSCFSGISLPDKKAGIWQKKTNKKPPKKQKQKQKQINNKKTNKKQNKNKTKQKKTRLGLYLNPTHFQLHYLFCPGQIQWMTNP